jgi:hypothetical protein
MARPQQCHFTLPGRYQSHATQYEGAHEKLAQLGVGLDDGAQALVVDREHCATVANADADETGDSAQSAHLPGKITRQQHRYQRFAQHPGQGQLEAPGQDDEEIPVTLAWLDQDLAGVGFDPLAMRFEARDLLCRELGKELFATLLEEIVDHRVVLPRCATCRRGHRIGQVCESEGGIHDRAIDEEGGRAADTVRL